MSDEDEQIEPEKKALITLSIELGDKKKQLLNIYSDSKPEQLAYDFCLQNNLDFDSMLGLCEEIKHALNNYKSDSNPEIKNQISEENEPNTSNKKKAKEEEKEEIEELERKEESGPKTEEVSEEHNIEKNALKNNNIENMNKEKEEEIKKMEVKKDMKEDKDKENDKEINKENKEKEINEGINKQENEENELVKEEEKDKMIDSNENKNKEEENNINNLEENNDINNQNREEHQKEEEKKENKIDENINEENTSEEDLPSYLSPTLCFQNKQRQAYQPKPKPEFSDFDTSYKKIDKIAEFSKEANEKVITHLIINSNNQKYLPKDYYDNPENQNFGERLYNKEKKMKEEAMEKAKLKSKKENMKKEENLTFTPKINDYNLIALKNRKKNRIQYNEEKRILNYKDYLQFKTENTKTMHYEEIEKENTFKPKLDKNSIKMAGNRSLQIPRYEQLYKKKKDLKKLENKIYDNKNMFKPKINTNYKRAKKLENNKIIF